MALGKGGQFLLLMWKEFTLSKRKLCSLVLQIILPIVFAVFLMLLRMLVKNEDISETIWDGFELGQNGYVGDYNRTEVIYSPNETAVNTIMTEVETKLQALDGKYSVTGYPSESELNTYQELNSAKVWAAVVFDASATYAAMPNDVKYTLRVARTKAEDQWRTKDTYPFFRVPGYRNNLQHGGIPYYYESGFLDLQYLVGGAIINNHAGNTNFDNLNFWMKKMPYKAFVKDNLLPILQVWLPFFIMLSFLVTALQTTKSVTYEKEKRLKESMKLMGMSEGMYWLTVFTKAFLFLFVACIFFTILFSVNVGGNGKVLNASQPSVIFVYLLCYCLSLISFCIMVSTFFSKANTASYAGGFLYFATFFPWFFLDDEYETMTAGQKLLSCLLFNTGMAVGFNVVGIHEGTGEGAQWNNFHQPASVDDNFPLLGAMLMLLFDTLIHLFITWYVGNVFPGEFGIPRPFYFPFTKTYWCGSSKEPAFNDDLQADAKHPEFFERDPPDMNPGISIRKLRKTFGRGKGKKAAVAGTTLNIYEGQITALLGHNGAGKTTTMSMLTGFIPPSSGTAVINGFDITNNINGVRQSLGLCPQHDILFDTLTVEEHLNFFAKLKGTPQSLLQKEVDDMLKTLGMEFKRKEYSMNLSGGQKRKVSVGIALIGGSKVLILDEPTSGMDPAARRQTWDILQKFREGRTMVLSTHFMDEADLLGDRIAIMAEGVVKCCGTSLFLKKAFGAGYHLVIVKDKSCDVSRVTELIQSHVPTAVLESEISAELSYLLPFDQSKSFAQLFTDVENKRSSLGINSFGTTATTMEEVFLKVGESGKSDIEEETERLKKMDSISTEVLTEKPNLASSNEKPGVSYVNDAFERNGDIPEKNGIPMVQVNGDKGKNENGGMDLSKFIGFNAGLKKNKGMSLSLQQFKSMIFKKAIHTWRNRLVTCVQLILPIVFTILAMVVEQTSESYSEEPALAMNLAAFTEGPISIYADANVAATTGIATKYRESFGASSRVNASPAFDSFVTTRMAAVGMSTFSKKYIIGLDAATNLTTYFNGDPFHSPGISLAYTLSSILQDYKSSSSYSISTTNHPFKRDLGAQGGRVGGSLSGAGFSVAFLIMFGMCFLSTTFILFLIKERISGAKHLQKVSGLSSFTYWLATFVWDYINYLFPAFLIVVVFAAFRPDAYYLGSPSRIGLILLLFLLFGWTCLPYTYMFHYLFKTPASGMVTVSMANIIAGLGTVIAIFVLMIPGLGTQDVAVTLDWIFAFLFPHYCLGAAIMNIYTNYEYIQTCERNLYQVTCAIPRTSTGSCCMGSCGQNCLRFTLNYMDMTHPGIGKYVLFMALQGVIYFVIIVMAELNVFNMFLYKMKSKNSQVGSEFDVNEKEEEDVHNERMRIENSSVTSLMDTDALVLKNLTKDYGTFRAVKGVSIGIPQQECFGLLGQNGAGKTTTFKMMTGDETVSRGNAYLNSYDVKNHIKQVQQNLGYCPQFDALIDQMTGSETLYMFARLRGVEESQIKNVVQELMKVLMLEKYANRQCGTYSGGNKRKLSTAIALIGDPPFVFLDEPTTGMDPGARRQLWNVLSQVRASGRTLVLTSHSMEECDALCTRLVIMVNGKFVCYGSPQHLKNKFGHGYTLIVRLNVQDTNPNPIKNFIKEKFTESQIFDDHNGYVHFQIPDTSVSLANVFGAMEEATTTFQLEDYSVHQTTLEQIFLTFTTNQIPPKEKKKEKGCCGLCTCCTLCACTVCCGD